MSHLYISKFQSEEGKDLYGLFYDDAYGKKCPYNENWKHVAFATDKEANEKLKLIEDERKREDEAEPFSDEDARKFAENYKWKFATTYAKTAPHEYLVKLWLPDEDQILYERFVASMKKNSVVGYFYGHENKYFILGNYYYWFMGQHDNMAVDLINRTTVDNLEYRDGAYYYKGKQEEKNYEVLRAEEEWQRAGAYSVRVQGMNRQYHIPLREEFDEHDCDGTKYIVLLDDGYPVATCRFYKISDKVVILGRLVVLPEYRGRGLGVKVLEEAEAWIKELDYSEIKIDSRVNAKGFYEKAGFNQIDDTVIKSGDFDCIKMHKII